MDAIAIAPSLPPELWTMIFEFLELKDIKTVRLVHSSWALCSQHIIWCTLSLCSVRSHHNTKVLTLIRNPILAPLVKHLISGDWSLKSGPSNSWTQDVTVGLSGLKQLQWKRPLQSWHHLLLSRQDGIQAAIALAPRLIGVSKVTLVFGFRAEDTRIPHPQLLSKLLVAIDLDRLQVLNLQLGSALAREAFSKALKELQVSFPRLQTLILNLGNVDHETLLKEDFQGLFDFARPSVRNLGLKCSTYKVPETSDSLLVTLGYFPKLSQIHFEFLGDTYAPTPCKGFYRFLSKHRGTLTRICIEPIPLLYLPSFVPLEEDLDSEVPCRIGKFKSMYFDCKLERQSLESQLALLGCFADTLTTLILTSTSRGRGFQFPEVKALVLALHKPPPYSILRNLKLTVELLSTRLFDLLAQYLEDLEGLALEYLGISDGSGLDGESSFFRIMQTRRYLGWNLRRIDVYGIHPPPNPIDKSGALRPLLSNAIPSVEVFGPIDLSDIRLDLNYFTSRLR